MYDVRLCGCEGPSMDGHDGEETSKSSEFGASSAATVC